VDLRRLLRGLIDGEGQAPVLELLVQVDCRRRQHDHDRPLDPVDLRLHPPRRRVLARRGDRELALRLEELERVRGLFGSRLLHDGEDLVLQVGFAEVVQGLPRHRRVLDPLLLREEREHGVHERRLARRARTLDYDRQRPLQEPRHAGQVRQERVVFLPDNPRLVERCPKPANQVRGSQPRQGLGPFGLRKRSHLRGCLNGPRKFRLRLFQTKEQPSHVSLE